MRMREIEEEHKKIEQQEKYARLRSKFNSCDFVLSKNRIKNLKSLLEQEDESNEVKVDVDIEH